jgi:hypothetical protein
MRWIGLIRFSGLVLSFANTPRERAIARTALLVLLRDRCGVDVGAKLAADDAADSASAQAVTRVNAEQASKRTMHGPT